MSDMFGIGAALSTGISGAFDAAGRAIDFRNAQRLAEQQNQYNLDMWNLNNEYNSPAQQMKRFEKAGLNPNLMYGAGTPGNSPSPPQKVVPENPEFGKGLAKAIAAQNFMGLLNSEQKLQQEIEHTKQERVKTLDMKDERKSWKELQGYEYDYGLGRWVRPYYSFDKDGNAYWIDSNGNTNYSVTVRKDLGDQTYLSRAQYKFGNMFARNGLFTSRAAALESQVNRNNAYVNYMVPVTARASFYAEPWRMSTEWWNDQISKGVGTASNAVGMFMPKNWLMGGPAGKGALVNPYTGHTLYY